MKQPPTMPELEQLENELKRVKYKRRYRSVLRSTIYALITVAAVAVLVATLWMPVLQIYGSSMTPTLEAGEIIERGNHAQLLELGGRYHELYTGKRELD